MEKVVFKHHNSIMNCDSASYDRANNSFIAYKNIEINENDSLHFGIVYTITEMSKKRIYMEMLK